MSRTPARAAAADLLARGARMERLGDAPIDLAACTTLGVGGPARHFTRVRTADEIAEVTREARASGRMLRILGAGSNVVVADEGLGDREWVVELELRGVSAEPCEADTGSAAPVRTASGVPAVRVTVSAGESWDAFVQLCVREGWAGIECLSGIPGKVGAAPIQNIGAYGQEVSETIESVDVLDLANGVRKRMSAAECGFSYRQSRFKRSARDCHAVLAVTFLLRRGAPATVRYRDVLEELGDARAPSLAEVRTAVLAIRARKSMVLDARDENRRSCGSFFLNPIVAASLAARVEKAGAGGRGDVVPSFPQADGRVKLSAAWLIEQAGFGKGYRRGAVGLSTRHSLALVAHDGARARDVIELAWELRRGVEERFAVRLVPEPVFWGFEALDDGLPVLESSRGVS